jgi:ABC-type polar amino acid transport system ATPase subunit
MNMTGIVIRKAERHQARLRLGLCGPSGSGKTYSALRLAKGLVAGTDGKIGLIDTERKSASLYAHLADFDVIELAPPYSPERYREAIHAMERHVGPMAWSSSTRSATHGRAKAASSSTSTR